MTVPRSCGAFPDSGRHTGDGKPVRHHAGGYDPQAGGVAPTNPRNDIISPASGQKSVVLGPAKMLRR